MSRKYVAAVFVALWFIFLGIEFSEDMGFLQYDEPEMDQCMEAALTGLGEAIKTSDDLQEEAPRLVFAALGAAIRFPSGELSLDFFGEASPFVKPDIPIYRLHQTFLI